MMIVTSPANHAKLDRYKEIAARLARAEGLTDEQAARAGRRGQGGGLDRRRPARHAKCWAPSSCSSIV